MLEVTVSKADSLPTQMTHVDLDSTQERIHDLDFTALNNCIATAGSGSMKDTECLPLQPSSCSRAATKDTRFLGNPVATRLEAGTHHSM